MGLGQSIESAQHERARGVDPDGHVISTRPAGTIRRGRGGAATPVSDAPQHVPYSQRQALSSTAVPGATGYGGYYYKAGEAPRGSVLHLHDRVDLYYDASPTFQLRRNMKVDHGRHVIKLGADMDLVQWGMRTSLKWQPARPGDSMLFPSFGMYGSPVPEVFQVRFCIFTDTSAQFRLGVGWHIQKKQPTITLDMKSGQRIRPRLGGRSLAHPSPPGLEYDAKMAMNSGSIVKATVSCDLPASGNLFGPNAEGVKFSVHNLRIKQHVDGSAFPKMREIVHNMFSNNSPGRPPRAAPQNAEGDELQQYQLDARQA
ncbi:hypothetical protein FVE85_8625 [Porphyridium purpureum]|uniref:Uncharacterized protein n=1 Tax=Porphyridium purpureum TaxID=35688 RepID=A0A5J4YQB3_PORPP|nr:hypothetical protein FVE85_8625 [Porphyridium purpureum]|eukprot:POR1860..scf296_7